ncbi:MAG: hypothetical protein LUH36_02955, partial [Oscillospiraceae bacterium]|nr:hypothetical protein [Oscillospiraceae bacterium]
MKRTTALLLALAMLFLLALAGCGSSTEDTADEAETAETLDEAPEEEELTAEAELTAESLLAAMQENMEALSSMTMEMSFTMDMTVDEENMVMDMGYTYQMTSDPEAAYVTVTIAYEADFEDESMTTTTETYVVLEDGVYVTYSGVDGEWYKMEIDGIDADVMDNYSILNITTDYTLEEETEKVNGTECFVLTCQLQGDDLQSLYEEMGLDSLMGGVDYSGLTVEETILLDTETLLPVQATVDFGDGLSAAMEASIDLSAEDDVDFSMEPCVVTVNYTGFNNVDEIAVPEEVIESAVSYDDSYDYDDYALVVNEDGTYVLEDGYTGSAVNIAVPAGHTIDEYSSDSTWLCFDAVTDDDSGYAWIYYSLYTDYTAEDMEYYFGDSFEDYADYYDAVAVTDLQTSVIAGLNVTYIAVVCGYDEGGWELEFYAWAELAEDQYLLIGGVEYTDMEELQTYTDLPALLETLVDAVDSDVYTVTDTDTDEAEVSSEDGIYILEDGYSDNTVSIAVPAGYVIDADSSDSTWLCFDLDENNTYAWAYYSLYTDYTAEDMEYYYGDSFEIYEEFYADVEISGPETVTIGGRDVTYLYVVYTYDDGDRCLDFYA